MHVCAGAYTNGCGCLWKPEGNLECCSSGTTCLVFETESHQIGAHQGGQTVSSKPQESTRFCLSNFRIMNACYHTQRFYDVGTGAWDSGPNACPSRTSPAQQSPHPCVCFEFHCGVHTSGINLLSFFKLPEMSSCFIDFFQASSRELQGTEISV